MLALRMQSGRRVQVYPVVTRQLAAEALVGVKAKLARTAAAKKISSDNIVDHSKAKLTNTE
jgi:hypothetical protein